MTRNLARYLPLTETTAYILLALTEPMHGYALMRAVDEMSDGTVRIGPGTLYSAFSTLESEGLIVKVEERERRKTYGLTAKGRQVIEAQLRRSAILVRNGRRCFQGPGFTSPAASRSEEEREGADR